MNFIKSYKLFEGDNYYSDYTVGQIISDCEDILIDLNDAGFKTLVPIGDSDLPNLELYVIIINTYRFDGRNRVVGETKERLDLFLSFFDMFNDNWHPLCSAVVNPISFDTEYKMILKYKKK